MEQLTNSPIDAKISIGMDKELKTLMESEAKQLGVKLSVYARSIMKNRSGSLLESGKSSIQSTEQVTKLQIENERLRLLLEKEPISTEISAEQTEEIEFLKSENEALRADMELLRAEENNIDSEAITSLEEDLTKANLRVEEVEGKLSNLQTAYTEEKENLLLKHKEEQQELIDEVNALTWSEISDEEAELIAQHEKEFKGIADKLKEEEARSADKDLVIEDLQKKLSNYENEQIDSLNVEAEKLSFAEAKIAELKEKLDTTSRENQENKEVLISAQEDLEEANTRLSELRQYKSEAKEDILEASQLIDDLREQLRSLSLEKEQLETSVKSQMVTNEQQEQNLEKMTLQVRQLLTEQEEKTHKNEQLSEKIADLKRMSAEETTFWENTSNKFLQNAEVAIKKLEQELNNSHELRSQCAKHEDLIGKYKIKLGQLMSRISELETERGEHKEMPKLDVYSDLQISEFTEKEMKLYEECLEFLSNSYKSVSNNNLLIASLYNTCRNKKSNLFYIPYLTSLKEVVKNFQG